MIEDALRYARDGWPVVPLHTPTGNPDRPCSCNKPECESVGKHPRTINGIDDATTDEAKIREWWGMWPQANIGGALGPVSGRFAGDVDPRNGGSETQAALIDEHGELPTTLTAGTGGDGFHFVFKWPAGYKGKLKGKLGPGFDVKADGGYIVLAPSLHASGKRYHWLNEAPITDAPAWMIEKLKEAKAPTGTSGDGEEYGEGMRHNALVSLAGTMRRRAMDVEEIEAALLVVNERRCKPPLPTDEVSRVAASMRKYAPDEWPVFSGSQLQDDSEETGSEESAAPAETGFYTSLDLLLEAKLIETEEIFIAVRRQQITMLVSTTNIGKTTLIQNLCLSAAAGESCLPLLPEIPAKPIRVGYMDFESTAHELKVDVARMLKHVTFSDCAKANFFPIVDASVDDEPLNLSNERHFAFVKKWVREMKIDVLVVDTIAAAFDLFNENDNAEVKRRVMRPLKKLALDGNCAVIAIHHKGKMGENETKEEAYAGRGASNFGALSRAVYTLTREDSKGPGYVTVKLAKAKGAKFEPTMLQLDFEGRWFTICGEKPPFKKSILTIDDVAEFVKSRKKVKTNAVLEEFSARASDRTIKTRLDEAETLGLIKSPKQGYWEFCATVENAQDDKSDVSSNGHKEIEGLCESATPIGNTQVHKNGSATPLPFVDDRPDWQKSVAPIGTDGNPLPF